MGSKGTRRAPNNRVEITNGVCHIHLDPAGIAVCDEADYGIVREFHWTLRVSKSGNRYALANRGRIRFFMHRLILAGPDGADTDHRDGNGLNNRRYNLRTATRSQNLANRDSSSKSGFRGVFMRPGGKSWRADIRVSGKGIYLGNFSSAEAAAAAYDKAAREYFGDFARTNK